MLNIDDTICAIASAPGGAVRGIVRVSGPTSVETVVRIASAADRALLADAASARCWQGVLLLGQPLGEVPAVYYAWPTARSYTRQPSVELHLPGSPPILEAALAALCQAGARLAQPGEFTLRAFLAGRLDLTQAEAVLGVIDAQSRRELDRALVQLAGGLARPLTRLREELLDLLAHLEAGLDFVDEDIEFIRPDELDRQLAKGTEQVAALLRQMEGRGRTERVPRVVLVGAPNVGKSSLLNALAGEAAAIVSDESGTTRDFVTRRVVFGGREVLLTDTAGIDSDANSTGIDALAQAATRRQLGEADLTLICVPAGDRVDERQADVAASKAQGRALVVLTKCDLPHAAGAVATYKPLAGAETPAAIATSSRTREGLGELRRAIARELDAACGEAGAIAGTADRCRDSLQQARESLERARAAAQGGLGEELVAAEVRLALEQLGLVAGAVYTEDILDRVFGRFCIGK